MIISMNIIHKMNKGRFTIVVMLTNFIDWCKYNKNMIDNKFWVSFTA